MNLNTQPTHAGGPARKATLGRLFRMFREFSRSSAKGRPILLSCALVGFLILINGLNVLNSYASRDFMTAIEHKNAADFIHYGWLWIGVFALATVAAVIYKFTEERLGLLWRHWLTAQAVTEYMENRVYLRVELGELVENPDQRIAEDIRTLTVNTLSFVLMLLNSAFTVVAFVGVIWSISPKLLCVAVAYASAGSLLTVLLGRSLIGLNSQQLDKEARFRAELIHVREHADLVAVLNREGRLKTRLLRDLEALVQNMARLISVNRNLGFFTTGYNYLIQIIPALVVAPMFIRGEEAQFGIIMQSAIAFTHLVNALSVIITQFPQISTFAAVVGRLSLLTKAFDDARSIPPSAIKVITHDDEVAYENLTLHDREHGPDLIRSLTMSVQSGTNVLVHGSNIHAASALFRATAGIRNHGDGTIIRPGIERMMFLPEKPYLSPGSLREMLLRSGQETVIPDDRIMGVLEKLKLGDVPERIGGLDAVHENWDPLLSLGEQKCLVVARLVLAQPKFAFLDRLHTALSEEEVRDVRDLICESGITCLTIAAVEHETSLNCYSAALELRNDGSWKRQIIRDGKIFDAE
jgi:vitamin B12/bleomycin/antimicrobial peptide transport system ATP-binding/permease protein